MYTEEYEKREFPYRNFFLKLILVIVFVLLLVWLLTKLFYNKNNNEVDGTVNEVFSNNLEKMKSGALSYYNENNLPTKIGDTDKLSLSKMIDKKLVTKIIDKEGKTCNQKKSYIKITKKENEYFLKVNLVCDDEEDYIVAHLNNYEYCNNTYICETKVENNDKEEIEDTTNNTDSNIISSNQSSNNIQSKTTTKKTTKKVSTKGKLTTNKGSIEITDTTTKTYLYEYSKTNNHTYSSWSLWNNWERVDCNTQEITCTSKTDICLKELKRYDRKENVDTYNKTYETTKVTMKYDGITTTSACYNNNYVKINNKFYKTAGDYSSINNVNASIARNINSWTYSGRSSYQTPPADTKSMHFILVGVDYSKCNNTCTNLPNYYYDKYIYNDNLTEITSSNLTCNTNTTKNIYTYNQKNENVTFSRTETLYGTVCYKSERQRTLISSGTTQKKWSNYNDKNLLNNGYNYTGSKKKK